MGVSPLGLLLPYAAGLAAGAAWCGVSGEGAGDPGGGWLSAGLLLVAALPRGRLAEPRRVRGSSTWYLGVPWVRQWDWVRRESRRRMWRWVGWIALLAWGAGRAWLMLGPPLPPVSELTAAFPAGKQTGSVTVRGELVNGPERVRTGWTGLVRPTTPKGARWLLSVTFAEGQQSGESGVRSHHRGDRLVLAARLRRPTPQNPGETPFAGISPYGRIGALAWVSGADVRWEASRKPASRWRAVEAIRDHLAALLDSGARPPGRGIVRALVLGDRSDLEAEVEDDFVRAGAVHLLVVSGLHLSVVATFSAGLGRRAGLSRRGQSVCALSGALAFAGLAGWRPPVTRAALMAVFSYGSQLAGRRRDAERGLWWAVLAMLAVQPLLLFDVGFRLTVAATWGVVALTSLLSRRWGSDDHLGRGWSAALAAQLATAPLTLLYFGRAPLTALVASPVLIVAGSFLVEGGVAAGLLGMMMPAVGRAVSAGLGAGGMVLWRLTQIAGRVPWAGLNLPGPPGWLVVSYFVTLGLSRSWWEGLLRSSGRQTEGGGHRTWWLALVGAVVLVWAASASGWSPWLRCTFLAVGEGDALHMGLPGGVCGPQVLVDTGNTASRPLSYLRRAAVQSLSALVLTHGHRDHAGGAVGIANALPVRTTFSADAGGQVGRTDRGVSLVVTGALGQGLANEACRRVIVRYGRFCLVDSGDAALDEGDPALAWLPDRESPAGKEMFLVVKVPHHGARDALTEGFLDRWRPDLAVISVGPNGYGHPTAQLLALLARRGVPVFRTDQSGAVRLATDGRRVRVRTYCR